MSREYSISIALVAGSLLKVFGIELESGVLEGLVLGVAALVLAVLRKSRGDINALGFRK